MVVDAEISSTDLCNLDAVVGGHGDDMSSNAVVYHWKREIVRILVLSSRACVRLLTHEGFDNETS